MTEGDIPPVATAGAVAAAKALLRLEGAQEDALLGRLAATALLLAEAFTGQRLIVRAFSDRVAADGGWRRLASEPVTAITGVSDGAAVDIDVRGVGWVRVVGGGAVTVAYEAGVGATWDALPVPVAQGIALLAVHLFENRTGEAVPPAAIAALWRPWRRVRVGTDRRAA